MPRFVLSAILIIFLGSLSIACKPSKKAPVEVYRTQKIDGDRAIAADVFDLVTDASIIKVTTIKDASIPVKGSFNLKSGRLTLSPQVSSGLEMVVDMTSWDSGLILRDDRVTRIFFGTDEDKNRTATFRSEPLEESLIAVFRKQREVKTAVVSGTFQFNGVSLPVTAQLKAGFNEYGRLVVTTPRPFTIRISDLKLNERLKKLMIVCNHQSVADEVSVTVHLEFVPAGLLPGQNPHGRAL